MTFYIILEQVLLHFPLVLGAYISIALMKVPDLSLESAYVFGAIIGAKTMIALHAIPIYIRLPSTLIASMLGGSIVGLVSSTLTCKAGLPHLLSSILTFGLFHGITQAIASSYISLSSYPNQLAIMPYITQHPELLCLLVLGCIMLLGGYYLCKTQLGYAYAVYGNNASFFSHYGVSTSYVFITGIILSNALAGFAGFLFAQSNGFAELNMGLGKALLCITALILGKAIVRYSKPLNIAIPVIGVVTYFSIQQTLLKIGFNLKYFTMFQACIVLIVIISIYKKQNGNKKSIDHLGV